MNCDLLSGGLKLSIQRSSSAWCFAGVVLVFGLIPGCATHATPKAANTSQDANALVVGDGVVDKIVVPTSTIMGEHLSSPKEGQPEDQSPAAPELAMSYRIGPGDILSFRSFDDEKLSMQVPVRYDGYISLQVIPDVKVEGLTRKEAEDLVREAYAEYYLEPQLTLSISEVKSKIFTVLGDVSRPSEYPYTRPITLMNAITIAGGPRVNTQGGDSYVGSQGQLVKAFLVRNTGNERKVLEFDLRGFQKSGPSPSDTPVYPDDTVYVPESANLVFLLGEVRQPRVYAVSEGLTLIRLLSLAGGYNESTARIREVAITREINDMETKIITFDVREAMRSGTDFSLEPGDIIYVPRKRLVNAEDFLQRVIAPASTGMSFAAQIMSLYQQAYSVYYTKEQFDRIYNNSGNSGDALTSSLQSLQQNLLQNTQSLQGILSGATQLVPSAGK